MYWKFERYVIVLVLLMLVTLQPANSQDSLKVADSKTKIINMDSLSRDTTSIVVFKHSPTKAALLSAVFPGLGQIYNKKYWKLPILYAGLSISAYFLIDNQKLYKKYYDGWVNYSNTHSLSAVKGLSLINPYIIEHDQIELAFEWYVPQFRRNRDWSVVFVTGFYVLGILDAAVDAYLFDYDISDKLTLKVHPTIINSTLCRNAFGVSLNFNLH